MKCFACGEPADLVLHQSVEVLTAKGEALAARHADAHSLPACVDCLSGSERHYDDFVATIVESKPHAPVKQ